MSAAHDGRTGGAADVSSGLFDWTAPSPLPTATVLVESASVPLVAARRALAALAPGDTAARSRAERQLGEAWVTEGVWESGLEALRAAKALDPESVSPRLVGLLLQAGAAREAAEAARALAQAQPSVSTWLTALKAWARADDPAETQRCLEALQALAPDDPAVIAVALGLARQRHGLGDAATDQLALRFALLARRRDDREAWRALSLDAWLLSRGTEGGASLVEALVATGRPRAAVYVAAESAAWALRSTPSDRTASVGLLERAARIAEGAGLPGEATAAWVVRSILRGAGADEARENLRDLLAERGRSGDLAARLRADARRAPPGARGAAWKGVAAIEIAYQPAMAATALAEALAVDPNDAEATELLQVLGDDPAAEASVRDALWGLLRGHLQGTPVQGATRARWLVWLGRLEERAGDLASAALAYGLVDEPGPEAHEAYESLARVHDRAEEQAARAERMLAAVSGAESGANAAVESLLNALGLVPGAFRDPRAVAKALGAVALRDERAATLWERVARRSDDPSLPLAVLRRLATRATLSSIRVRAAVATAELLDRDEGDRHEAAELLVSLLDELPEEPPAAATLAALAEHLLDDTLTEDALRAVARATVDPWERDLLARFAVLPPGLGPSSAGIFGVFAHCLGDPAPGRERTGQLARFQDLVGESAVLLALRTRSLLAQTGPLDDSLVVARRFAEHDPYSPEATIAWFGAASLAGEVGQIVTAARAVADSLAAQRDVAAVCRTAMVRLQALSARAEAAVVVRSAAAAGALSDRGLRGAVAELAYALGPAESAGLYEALLVASQDAAERAPWLATLAERYGAARARVPRLGALLRLARVRPEVAWEGLLELSELLNDRAEIAGALASLEALTLDPQRRRALTLRRVVELAAEGQQQHRAEVLSLLDRLVAEQRGDEAQSFVARSLAALGWHEEAIERLVRWADASMSDEAAAERLLAAARLCEAALEKPSEALTLVRKLLRRAALPQAILVAEQIAARHGLKAEMLVIFDELRADAAGSHGRHALAFRRAAFLEQVGDLEGALDEHLRLFEQVPGLGASFSAIERLASATGRHDQLLRALEGIARSASSPAARSKFFLRAADVADDRGADSAALRFELLAWQEDREPSTRERLLARALAANAELAPQVHETLSTVVDDELAAGNQSWDDDPRRAHALRALTLAAAPLRDLDRASAAVGLYLRHHPAPLEGRARIVEALSGPRVDAATREALLASPALTRLSTEAPAIELQADHFADLTFDDGPELQGASVLPEAEPPVAEPPVAETPVAETPVAETPAAETPAAEPEVVVRPALVPTALPPALGAPAPAFAPQREQRLPSDPPSRPSGRPSGAPAVVLTRASTPPPPAIAPKSGPPDALEIDPVAEARRISLAPVETDDDRAQKALAERLSHTDETRTEALAIERRRFQEAPARLDALDALATLSLALRRTHEANAVLQLRAVLTGASERPMPKPLDELEASPDGIARVIFSQSWGPFAELGAILWEGLGPAWRREAQRNASRQSLTTGVFATSHLGRLVSRTLAYLQLPRTTVVMLAPTVMAGAEVNLATPVPSVFLDADLSPEAPTTAYVLGRAMEMTRPGFLPFAALGAGELSRLVTALQAAYGRQSSARLDPAVATLAARLVDGQPPRTQRRLEDLVRDLGERLDADIWSHAVTQAQARAGLMVSGDFAAAAEVMLREAPPEVSRDPRLAILNYEPLRELARFAVSEEYLLLRW